jgi:hypothetical protein
MHSTPCLTPSPSTPQADSQIIAGATHLLREHGLLDAKSLVAADASVLLQAAKLAQAQAEAEAAAAAAEAAALAEAEVAAEGARAATTVASVMDAIKRSPLMLDLPATHPGMSSLAGMVSFDSLIVQRNLSGAATAAQPHAACVQHTLTQKPHQHHHPTPPHSPTTWSSTPSPS